MTVGTSVTNFTGANPNRIALIISPPSTGNITISTQGDFSAGQGLVIISTNNPVKLSVSEHGNLVTNPLNILGSTSNITVGWCEISLGDC